MTDRDAYNVIHEHIAAINRTLNNMPTTSECWAFVLGFAMCGAFILALSWGAVLVGQP